MKKLFRVLKRFIHDNTQSARMLEEIKKEMVEHSDTLRRKLNEMIEILKIQAGVNFTGQHAFVNNGYQGPPSTIPAEFEPFLQKHPLMFADKTYNTSHPDYDASLARNFPGKIFNFDHKPANLVYSELKKLIINQEIPESQWSSVLKETLEEVKTIPHADQLFQSKDFVERYLLELEAKYNAFYRPGWVNLDDAIFLYWVVRRLKPKTIVQTGVCNGLSSAFMTLALAKNGQEGSLYAIDMPPIFDSNDEAWKVKGKIYGVTIPEGKTSGWLVPDAYRHRFEVFSGDAKLLLPDLLKRLGKVDMFYHDSDHTYDHMMFEFKEVKKYLIQPSVIVSDDISWNSSLWDFADLYSAFSYNYRGSMGITCF